MDAIRDAISNVSLYEVKAAVRKAQNVVMNYTEMEAKVREATNNEPWGASSTVMNEIASGTYNYQLLNEIMPMIYKRFTEKAAEEWRQIYKSLQLLEFLIKNGAEQVIDDARSHLSTIKMLRQFYFIDASGKDQGVNVRNRAKELAELLSDVDKIRQERKKARQTKSKYIGHEGSGGGTGGGNYGASSLGGAGARQSRFGGFGSDTGDFGGSSGGGVYGDGGGYGGQQASSSFQDDGYSSRTESRPNKFDEYDEYDDGGAMAARRTTPARRPQPPVAAAAAKPPPKKKEPEPEIDLLGGDDEPFQAPSNGKAAASSNFAALSASDDFDDFDDFQSATPAPTAPVRSNFSSPTPLTSSASGLNLVQPKPLSTTQQSDMTSLTGFTSPSPSVVSSFGSPAITPATTGTGFGGMSDMKPINSGFQPAQPNYFTSVPVAANNPTPSPMSRSSTGSSMQQPKKSSNDAFGSIWNQASSGIKKSTTPTAKTASLQSMAQEKASAGIWGTGAAAKPPGYSGYSGNTTGNGLDDLLG